jgi:hypothetical protein
MHAIAALYLFNRIDGSDDSPMVVTVGSHVWMVQNGVRIVHRVIVSIDWTRDAFEMVCGVQGEVATSLTRRKHLPFIVATNKQLTCFGCIGDSDDTSAPR